MPSIDSKIFRILDANANRAREALRVLEDAERFLSENPERFERLRRLRHKLSCLTAVFYESGIESRDSASDRGRTVVEAPRADLATLRLANFRRAEEASRVLEEYAKVVLPEQAHYYKEIRYALYALEKNAGVKLSLPQKKLLPRATSKKASEKK